MTQINFVFISPHFPPRFRFFAIALKQKGVNVLGIGDEPYESLHPELRDSLREYYKVTHMENYNQLYRAVGHFIHQHGRINYIESFNEYWLETEAALRADFNVAGYKPDQMDKFKKKSYMKQVFEEARLPVVPGLLAKQPEDVIEFAKKVGYPMIMKPDTGVGGDGARKIRSDEEALQYFNTNVPHFYEPFITGVIETYDGLADNSGNVLFYSSLCYDGIAEVLSNPHKSIFYYVNKEVKQDVAEAGQRAVIKFDVRNRFFHFEFFRTKEGKLYFLEVNLRPPGGICVDAWNFAHRIDMYAEYANVVTKQPPQSHSHHPDRFCVFVGRRDMFRFKHSHEDIIKLLGPNLRLYYPVPKVFSPVMGNQSYVFLCDNLDEMRDTIKYIEEQQ
eukprot:TRINITY_DN4573_c1_g1_i1.p1 TRINITY_DN4573_c1_g1~~TRINITY_DN4573_c1_g1_i1.p1  ORF type:complete len:415 (-),score=88.87 TRINITY_DN4573_c1_g1_i1:11-1177(-)